MNDYTRQAASRRANELGTRRIAWWQPLGWLPVVEEVRGYAVFAEADPSTGKGYRLFIENEPGGVIVDNADPAVK